MAYTRKNFNVNSIETNQIRIGEKVYVFDGSSQDTLSYSLSEADNVLDVYKSLFHLNQYTIEQDNFEPSWSKMSLQFDDMSSLAIDGGPIYGNKNKFYSTNDTHSVGSIVKSETNKLARINEKNIVQKGDLYHLTLTIYVIGNETDNKSRFNSPDVIEAYTQNGMFYDENNKRIQPTIDSVWTNYNDVNNYMIGYRFLSDYDVYGRFLPFNTIIEYKLTFNTRPHRFTNGFDCKTGVYYGENRDFDWRVIEDYKSTWDESYYVPPSKVTTSENLQTVTEYVLSNDIFSGDNHDEGVTIYRDPSLLISQNDGEFVSYDYKSFVLDENDNVIINYGYIDLDNTSKITFDVTDGMNFQYMKAKLYINTLVDDTSELGKVFLEEELEKTNDIQVNGSLLVSNEDIVFPEDSELRLDKYSEWIAD